MGINLKARTEPGVSRIRSLVDADRGAILRLNNASVPALGALDDHSLQNLLVLASATLVVAPPEAPDRVALILAFRRT